MYYFVSDSNMWDPVVSYIARFSPQECFTKQREKENNLRFKVGLISNENLRGQCLEQEGQISFPPFSFKMSVFLFLFFLSTKLKPRDNDNPLNVSSQVTTLLLQQSEMPCQIAPSIVLFCFVFFFNWS